MRVEDLDPSTRSGDHEAGQLGDLRRLGVDWDGDIVRQSDRFDLYHEALRQLIAQGKTYECYCSRREVREAVMAAHSPQSHYPGTCRDLSVTERARREASGRPAAIRFRGDGSVISFDDRIAGPSSAAVDDVVLRRNDGTPAYNLAVVVDDADQGIEEVVRGDDLLASTPAQIAVGRALGLRECSYAHVPLAYGPTGDRLAKRDGAVTLADLATAGLDTSDVARRLLDSIFGSEGPSTLAEARGAFVVDEVDWLPWNLTASELDMGGQP